MIENYQSVGGITATNNEEYDEEEETIRRYHFSHQKNNGTTSNDTDTTPLLLVVEAQGVKKQPPPQQVQAQAQAQAHTKQQAAAQKIYRNFVCMSLFFGIHHGCAVSCLSLSTAKFGSIGAGQSAVLYLSYTLSSLLGATYVVKQLGPRNALILGMSLYCVYVGCFFIASEELSLHSHNIDDENENESSSSRIIILCVALVGATIGGIGAGLQWTAQGTYFSMAAEEYAITSNKRVTECNSQLAGIFAFIYLIAEVMIRLLSTLLLNVFGTHTGWLIVYSIYTVLAIVSTLCMGLFTTSLQPPQHHTDHRYHEHANISNNETSIEIITTTKKVTPHEQHSSSIIWYKITAAYQLFVNDPKMKYMMGLNAVFGFTAAFLNSYVNGEVIPVALQKHGGSKNIGIFTSWISFVAAIMSLLFSKMSRTRPISNNKKPKHNNSNGIILTGGAASFFFVVFPFVVFPEAEQWNFSMLFIVYTLHGIGRATFESTLKATFADFFHYEKEGAFANIILQNGMSACIGYFLSFSLLCHPHIDTTAASSSSSSSNYCIEYRDGSYHDVLSFELIVIISAITAIFGYWKASSIHQLSTR